MEFLPGMQDRLPYTLAILPAHQQVVRRNSCQVLAQNDGVNVRHAGLRTSEIPPRVFGKIKRGQLIQNVTTARSGKQQLRVDRSHLGHVNGRRRVLRGLLELLKARSYRVVHPRVAGYQALKPSEGPQEC